MRVPPKYRVQPPVRRQAALRWGWRVLGQQNLSLVYVLEAVQCSQTSRKSLKSQHPPSRGALAMPCVTYTHPDFYFRRIWVLSVHTCLCPKPAEQHVCTGKWDGENMGVYPSGFSGETEPIGCIYKEGKFILRNLLTWLWRPASSKSAGSKNPASLEAKGRANDAV